MVIYRKFNVTRVDPEAQARHEDCFSWVLDVDHDPYALAALRAYATACQEEDPELARELITMVNDRGRRVEGV